MSFKAVVFDLDGTLLNTIDDLGDSMNEVLASFGFPLHTIDQYKLLVGKGLVNLVTVSLPEDNRDEKTIDSCLIKMREAYGDRWSNKTSPYPGIPELLDSLTAKKIPMAILSNKVHQMTILIVEKLLGGWRFSPVFGERPGIPRKPDPLAAHEILNTLGLLPEEVVYLGDSGSDMLTAVNSGMYPVGALWGFRDESELSSHGAKMLINKPSDLLILFA